MKFALTAQLIAETEEFALRSACVHCYFFVASDNRCGLDWPMGDQARWPLDRTNSDGSTPTDVEFCKEFELG